MRISIDIKLMFLVFTLLLIARRGYCQVPANFPDQEIVDLSVPWYRRLHIEYGIVPNRVPTAFTNKFATLFPQVPDQIAPFHAIILNSS